MSNSPGFSYFYVPPPPPPPPPPPSAGLGIGAAMVCLIVLAVAFKCMCKVVPPSDAELLNHHSGNDDAGARPRSPREQRDGDRRLAALVRPRLPAIPLPAAPLVLPAFVYNRSLQEKAAEAGEEAATCSVCLGALEFGEMVRLLPVCLHIYHAECIDPWLVKHSTCPVCRSETDPARAMEVGQLPPV